MTLLAWFATLVLLWCVWRVSRRAVWVLLMAVVFFGALLAPNHHPHHSSTQTSTEVRR